MPSCLLPRRYNTPVTELSMFNDRGCTEPSENTDINNWPCGPPKPSSPPFPRTGGERYAARGPVDGSASLNRGRLKPKMTRIVFQNPPSAQPPAPAQLQYRHAEPCHS